MLELLVAGGVGLAGISSTLTLGIMAWRARGEAVAATRRELEAGKLQLDAERRADQWGREKLDADAKTAAATTQLEATKAELERVRAELAAARIEKGNLYAKLAALGAPVGDTVVDSAIDGLFSNADHRETR